MKIVKVLLVAILSVGLFVGGWFASKFTQTVEVKDIPGPLIEKLKPLDKYTFENLSKAEVPSETISIDHVLKDETDFQTQTFSLKFDPTLTGGEKKRVTGVVNTPKSKGPFPLVVMFRGYVDQTIYSPGTGTKSGAEFFAKHGYMTIAPDFFGYGGSNKEAENIFESRFQTYTTAIQLLASVDSLENWDKKNIFIWGHSNGGQVALTTLEITGKNIPTVLWAPVTKPFPYSVLYYTDESDDHGKLIRTELSKFESDYDVEKYSLTNYLDRINAPIEFHQGTADDAVPVAWTNLITKNLKKLEKDVTYFTYPGSDHNLRPAWDTVAARSLDLFNKHLN